MSPEGKLVGISGVADTDLLLLSLCMFEVLKREDGTRSGLIRCSLGTVSGWLDRISKPLIAKAKEINGLKEEVAPETLERLKKQREELDAKIEKLESLASKNDQPTTTDGSE